MSTRISRGGPIIAETADGLKHGQEVIVEKPDTCTRIVGAVLLPAGIGALGLDAVERTRYVESDGDLHKVTKVVERSSQ